MLCYSLLLLNTAMLHPWSYPKPSSPNPQPWSPPTALGRIFRYVAEACEIGLSNFHLRGTLQGETTNQWIELQLQQVCAGVQLPEQQDMASWKLTQSDQILVIWIKHLLFVMYTSVSIYRCSGLLLKSCYFRSRNWRWF